MRQLLYWIFTSGEEGVHGTDWGVKHSSAALSSPHELDGAYRDLLKKFNFPPNLERPQIGVGLLALPWQTGSLLIFIFPSQDLKGRPNTIAAVCIVPADICASFSIRETARNIWSCNNLELIARNSASRPDTLVLNLADNNINNMSEHKDFPFMVSSLLMDWPVQDTGYFYINQNIREIKRNFEYDNNAENGQNLQNLNYKSGDRDKKTQERGNSKIHTKILILCALILCIAAAVIYFEPFSQDFIPINEVEPVKHDIAGYTPVLDSPDNTAVQSENVKNIEIMGNAEKLDEILDIIKNDPVMGNFYRAKSQVKILAGVNIPVLNNLNNFTYDNFNLCTADNNVYGFICGEALHDWIKSLYLSGAHVRRNVLNFNTKINQVLFDIKIQKMYSEIFYSLNNLKPENSDNKDFESDLKAKLSSALNDGKNNVMAYFNTNYNDVYLAVLLNQSEPIYFIASKQPLFVKKKFIDDLPVKLKQDVNEIEISFWNEDFDKADLNDDEFDKFIDLFINQAVKNIQSRRPALN